MTLSVRRRNGLIQQAGHERGLFYLFISETKKGAEERIPGSSAQSESWPCLTPSRKTSQMISRQERRRFVINAFMSCEMSFRCHTIPQNERHEEPKPFYFSRCLLIWPDRQLSLHSSDPAVPMRRPSVTRRDSQFGVWVEKGVKLANIIKSILFATFQSSPWQSCL